MTRYLTAVFGFLAAWLPSVAWAEEAVNAYSRGNAMLYYTFITAVLVYGLHDTFRKRWLTLSAVVVLPLVFYLLLPAQ